MEKIILEIKNLSFSYNSHEIFKKLNLSFSLNKIYSFFGNSGAGKTTFLKIISLLFRELDNYNISGEIFFKGNDILKIRKEFWKIRRKIVYISQKPECFKTSIFKNIAFPLELLNVKDKNFIKNEVMKVLKEVNLLNEVQNKLDSSALNLSGGQQQRLAIARALTLKPDILLFDEPTSSLDDKNTEIIENLIIKLKEKHTIFIVSHNESRMTEISDSTYTLKDKKFLKRS